MIAIQVAVLINCQQDGKVTVGERSSVRMCCRRQSALNALDLNGKWVGHHRPLRTLLRTPLRPPSPPAATSRRSPAALPYVRRRSSISLSTSERSRPPPASATSISTPPWSAPPLGGSARRTPVHGP